MKKQFNERLATICRKKWTSRSARCDCPISATDCSTCCQTDGAQPLACADTGIGIKILQKPYNQYDLFQEKSIPLLQSSRPSQLLISEGRCSSVAVRLLERYDNEIVAGKIVSFSSYGVPLGHTFGDPIFLAQSDIDACADHGPILSACLFY